MRYFWHFLVIITLIATVTIAFFAFSLSTKDHITFNDQETLTAPTVTIVDPSTGPDNAKVTIVNFGDYQCALCADLDTSLVNLKAEYGNAVRIIWKDMPNTSQHPQALDAAIAAQCAGEQDKFWEYHNLLMANHEILNAELYTQLATELGLKDRAFSRCLEEQTTWPLVQRGFDEGLALGITATPTLYINGERYTGAMTTTEIRRIIDRLISDM